MAVSEAGGEGEFEQAGADSRADLERAGAPLILDTIAALLPHVID